MTTTLPVKRRSQIRMAIRRAALQEFSSEGFNGASTQSIAKRAGISKAQLHYYIDGKQELYEDILLSVIEKWDDDFFDSATCHDPRAAISTYIEKKIKHAVNHPLEGRLFSQEIARGAPVIREFWEQSKSASQRACNVINEWVQSGKIRPVDPLLLQMELWAVTQHYADYEAQVRFFMGLEAGEPLDEAKLIQHTQNLFLRSIGLEMI